MAARGAESKQIVSEKSKDIRATNIIAAMGKCLIYLPIGALADLFLVFSCG